VILNTCGDKRVPATNGHGLQVAGGPAFPAPSFFFEGTG